MNAQKTVNLLPEWYRKELRQRKRLRRHLGMLLALGGVLVGLGHFSQVHLGGVKAEHDALQAQAAGVTDVSGDIVKIRADNDRLQDRQLACRDLGAAVPMSKVMQQIYNEMEAGTTISRLNIEVKSEALKGSGFVGDRSNPPKFHDVAHIVVVGVVKEDRQANHLFSELSKNPLFTEVTMTYLRTEIMLEYEVRRFELQMTMDLDRLSLETPGGEETPKGQQVRTIEGGAMEEVSHGS